MQFIIATLEMYQVLSEAWRSRYILNLTRASSSFKWRLLTNLNELLKIYYHYLGKQINAARLLYIVSFETAVTAGSV